jgi:hypothetical protein
LGEVDWARPGGPRHRFHEAHQADTGRFVVVALDLLLSGGLFAAIARNLIELENRRVVAEASAGSSECSLRTPTRTGPEAALAR